MGILSGGPAPEGALPGKTHMEITGLRKRWLLSSPMNWSSMRSRSENSAAKV